MNIIEQIGVIIGITYLGEIISRMLSLAIPGPVIGMLILFILLYFKFIKISSIQLFSDLLLSNLAFFFIPPGVGLISAMDTLAGNWLKLMSVIIITTILTIACTGWTVDYVIKRGEKNARKS